MTGEKATYIKQLSKTWQGDEGIRIFAGIVSAGFVMFLFLYFALPIMRNARAARIALPETLSVQSQP